MPPKLKYSWPSGKSLAVCSATYRGDAVTTERWLQLIIEKELNRRVVLHDDGSQPSMYDLRIGSVEDPDVAIEWAHASWGNPEGGVPRDDQTGRRDDRAVGLLVRRFV